MEQVPMIPEISKKRQNCIHEVFMIPKNTKKSKDRTHKVFMMPEIKHQNYPHESLKYQINTIQLYRPNTGK
jgi:hypothetical protein